MKFILGLNMAYHESSACLLKDGNIVALVEEERFNRIRHAKLINHNKPVRLPLGAIMYCLDKAGIGWAEIDVIAYSLIPKKRFQKNIGFQHGYSVADSSLGSLKSEKEFLEKNNRIKEETRRLGFKGDFEYIDHHDCHAASVFFSSPYAGAGVMVVDGIGEFATTTLYIGTKSGLERIYEINFPNSLGFLWEKLTQFMGFSIYSAAKVMGLASYGNPQNYWKQFNSLVTIKKDGSFLIDDSITRFRDQTYWSGLEKLFSISKRTEPIKVVDSSTAVYADLAAALQKVTDTIVINLSRKLRKESGSKNLCYAGGVALNCVTNSALASENIFKHIFIPPYVNDAGTALGAALYTWNVLLKNPKNFVFTSPYTGPEYSNEDIRQTLESIGLNYERHEDVEKKTADILADDKIISWFQGSMEIGPRALGNRSILANPGKEDLANILNKTIKYREPFRPFAPAVLAEKANVWFELPSSSTTIARFMLGSFSLNKEKKGLVPAVTHVDGSSRIQIVNRKDNPKFYLLIKEFEKRTGIPMVLNTSFNVMEPIVCSPFDAINTFLNSQLDYLVINNFVIPQQVLPRKKEAINFHEKNGFSVTPINYIRQIKTVNITNETTIKHYYMATDYFSQENPFILKLLSTVHLRNSVSNLFFQKIFVENKDIHTVAGELFSEYKKILDRNLPDEALHILFSLARKDLEAGWIRKIQEWGSIYFPLIEPYEKHSLFH